MTAAPSPGQGVEALCAGLEAARDEPERVCQWCMARPGEWCEHDCANPERRCHPSYVAQYAADRGAYADSDAALIVAAVNAVPVLIAELRRLDAAIKAVEELHQLDNAEDGTVDAAAVKRVDRAWRHIDAIAAANPGTKGAHYADAARILRRALDGTT